VLKSLNKLNLAQKKGKILKFLQDADYYFELALDCLDAEDYLNALDYIRRAIKIDPHELDFRFLLAQIYSDMGLYAKSNFEYFKLLSLDQNLGECFLRISQNYYMMRDEDSAIYYIKKGMEFDFDQADFDEDDDIAIDYETMIRELSGNKLKLISKNIEDQMLLNYANKLMSISEYDSAMQLLSYVRPDSRYYINALNSAAFCSARVDNPRQEIEFAQKVLEIEPYNVNALCNLADGYAQLGDIQEAQKIADIILQLKITDSNDYYKAAIALLQCGYNKQAIKYLCDFLSFHPYHEAGLLLLSLAYYNQKELDLAQECVYKLVRIDNSNTIAKYYNQFFQSSQEFRELEYIKQAPKEEAERRIKMFEEIVEYPSADLIKLIKSDSELFDYAKWIFEYANINLSQSLIEKLARLRNAQAQTFLRECLVDNTLSFVIKQRILRRLLSMLPTKKIALVHEEEIRFISPKVTKNIFNYPKAYFEAFIDVFTSLAFVDRDYETEFNRSTRRVLSLCSARAANFKSRKNIAALFAYNFKRPDIFRDLNTVVKIFGANKKTVMDYLKKLGIEI
jgi:tetratricopeptide (TPR) repeat protein